MSTLVVEYEPESGEIRQWRYHSDDDYEPEENELTPDIDHRELERMRVEDGELVENPDFDSRTLPERVTTSENEIEEAKNEAKAIKSAVGYDEIDTEEDRDRTLAGRLDELERANGIGDRQPKKGIAHRLDAIEDTQEEILKRLAEIEEEV